MALHTDFWLPIMKIEVMLPDGVDVFIATNQTNDPKCDPDGSAGDCTSHKALDQFIKYAISRVDWAAVDYMIADMGLVVWVCPS